MLEAQLKVVKAQILENDRRVRASALEMGRRLMEIPGVGPLLASAFVATVADPHAFKSGRLSAWIGLVPKQNSSGDKEKLGSISKAGDRYLRQLLVVGSMAGRSPERQQVPLAKSCYAVWEIKRPLARGLGAKRNLITSGRI